MRTSVSATDCRSGTSGCRTDRQIDPLRLSFEHALRAILIFTPALAREPLGKLPQIYLRKCSGKSPPTEFPNGPAETNREPCGGKPNIPRG
jgi:hypothetical protein